MAWFARGVRREGVRAGLAKRYTRGQARSPGHLQIRHEAQ